MIFIHLTTTSWNIGQTMSRQAMTRALSKFGMNMYFTPHKNFQFNFTSGLIREIEQNILLLKPASSMGMIYRNEFLKTLQINRQIRWLKKVLRRYKREKEEPVILYVWHYIFLPFVEKIKHDVLIYHIYDDVFMYYKSDPQKKDVAAERKLIDESDIVLVVGEDLARHKKVNRTWIPCPGGVNMDIFKKLNPNLKQFGLDESDDRKKVGYFGRINSKVDFPLVYEIVRNGQDFLFLFAGLIGNMDKADKELWHKILEFENVRYFGARTQAELVHLYNALDVGFMPYHYKKGWSQFAIPLKFSEFMAIGKPVVSTPLIPLRKFGDLVELEDTPEGFLKAFKTVIESDSPQKQKERLAFAKKNSWEERAKLVIAEINKILESKYAS